MHLIYKTQKERKIINQIEKLFHDNRFYFFNKDDKLTVIDLMIYKSKEFLSLPKYSRNYILGFISNKIKDV
jgi:hypothetical protein